MSKIYEKSEDETLTQLAQRYYAMREEAKYLSKLVKKHLEQYDEVILNSSAIMMDDWLRYRLCELIVQLLCVLLAQGVATWLACKAVCSTMLLICYAWGFGFLFCVMVFLPPCYAICNKVLYWILYIGVAIACMYVGLKLCELLGFCP
ncbi:MAG: hypothetical protein NDP24_06280 [Crenarchaeota archaeon]|nr:hypothetical protein [Thermoproteota archaeon]